MPFKYNNFIRGYILGLSRAILTYLDIIKICKQDDINISKKGIYNIIHDKNIKFLFKAPTEKWTKDYHPISVRTPATVKKVKKYITKENPMPQRDIAKLIGTSVSTINKIINKDLGLKATKKHAVHKLFQSHIRQRHTISRYFYENFLAADRWKFIVTYDEAWLYLTDCDRKRAIYYQKRVEKSRPIWLKECAESYPKGFMVACGPVQRGVGILIPDVHQSGIPLQKFLESEHFVFLRCLQHLILQICNQQFHSSNVGCLRDDLMPCAAAPNMEYKRCSSCIPGLGALTGYYQLGQLSPGFFTELVTTPSPPFSSGLGTGKGGVKVYRLDTLIKLLSGDRKEEDISQS
ncbi:hypothetical protein LAZ67_5001650 [Cordylochernes scorpioides]|uniref:Uncharacterized protein n=1 Tax=Cordylochernes scorpioides TaxID=51811 RepID=A0ABY6KGK1_9ARAC|nr:hypothetical protein LAZ67_5001650 [Cordylochernes scorpioides]